MKSKQNSPADGKSESADWIKVSRYVLAGVVLLLAFSYAGGVVLGKIPPDHRIDATSALVIGISILLAIVLTSPETIERVKHFKAAGIELDLERIRSKQDEQEGQLDAINLLLPLLLKEAEIKHLKNLREQSTQYVGNHELRKELRKLRAMGLIKNKKDKRVGAIKDTLSFDLSEFVELTTFGQGILLQLQNIEKAKVDLGG